MNYKHNKPFVTLANLFSFIRRFMYIVPHPQELTNDFATFFFYIFSKYIWCCVRYDLFWHTFFVCLKCVLYAFWIILRLKIENSHLMTTKTHEQKMANHTEIYIIESPAKYTSLVCKHFRFPKRFKEDIPSHTVTSGNTS